MFLENEWIHVGLDEKGAISSIEDKRLKRQYIGESAFLNLFRIMIPVAGWDGRHADARDAGKPEVKSEGSGLALKYDNLISSDGEQLNIEFTVHMELDEDRLKLWYRVENMEEDMVSHIMFPIINGLVKREPAPLLVTPEQSIFDDTRIKDPFLMGDGNHKDWLRMCNRMVVRYPQMLAAAWMDYSDGEGGIGLEQRSQDFDVCDFSVERLVRKASDCRENNRQCIQLALQGYPSAGKGAVEVSPVYVLSVHMGDWHTVAAGHRDWLRGVVKQPEVPEKFLESIGWHFYFMKQQDGTVYRTYRELPQMARAALDAGLGYIMVFGWYQAGHDNNYPFGYYVNEDWGGAGELKEALEECRAMGCGVIPFFNGTLLDISSLEYRELAEKWLVRGRTGSPYIGGDYSRANFDSGFFNSALSTTTRNNALLDICITSSQVRGWWKETVERIVVEYGFGNLQLDQIAHKSYVCYDPSHGHKKPQTAYTEELGKLLEEVRGIVKKDNRDGIVIGEGFTDLTAQYCDGFWNWNQAYNHPEVIRYSLPWMIYSHETDANEYDTANLCFAEKILLDLKIDGGDGILSDYTRFSEHLKKLQDLKTRIAGTYAAGEYRHLEGIQTEENGQVRIRVYKNMGLNRSCIIMANLTDSLQYAEFTIKEEAENMMLYRTEGDRESMKTEAAKKIVLAPFEVAALEY